jgi:hypothetical protein
LKSEVSRETVDELMGCVVVKDLGSATATNTAAGDTETIIVLDDDPRVMRTTTQEPSESRDQETLTSPARTLRP